MRQLNTLFSPGWFLGILVGSVLATGCKNTIEPFSEKATYSIYGVLSLDESRQFIRVKPLHAPLNGSRTYGALDATVTLHTVTAGTSETLTDSVVIFRDDDQEVATHNYWTDTPIQPATEYRLVIEGPDGTTTEATTTSPPQITAQASPPQGHCETSFFVDFPGIKREKRVLSVTVGFMSEEGPLEFEIHDEIYNADHGKPDNAFIVFEPVEFLVEELDRPVQNPATPHCETFCSQLTSNTITIHYTYAGKHWYGRVPETLSDPIDSPTVSNGSGYFGSIATHRSTIQVDTVSIPSDHPKCP